jgi:phosphatidylserine/phosphatidylglycerophosphate/cardiolipin synthase-like enzyme
MLDIWRQETCWRTASAGRVAFLVDYQSYFSAAYEAVLNARRSIVLLGWGFDPRTRLAPDGADVEGEPDEIGRVLQQVTAARPNLDVRLLIWKSALPISATQEFFPHKARQWFEDTPVKFWLDDTVPFGACHHQKVLIIDDQIAFVSSGDFCVDRWDSTAHRHDDLRRRIAHHGCHAPRHEATVLLDGPVVHALSELANRRWEEATRETAEVEPPLQDHDPWPSFVAPVMRNVPVAVARTLPAWREQPEVTEIRELTLASIRAAKKLIYLENQYFTAPVIAEALAARLSEPYGPEVVLVSTQHAPSWFDRLTMDRARGLMIRRLQEADIFGRFRVLAPVTTGERTIIVHSKIAIIDDDLVRVGSANLNHRSGGFDTELEVAIKAQGDEDRRAVAAFRNELVGHFLARDAAAVEKAMGADASLVHAIDMLNRHGRMKPIRPQRLGRLSRLIAEFHIGDPTSVRDSFRPYKRRRAVERQVHTIAAEGGVMRFISSLRSRLSGEDGRSPPGSNG